MEKQYIEINAFINDLRSDKRYLMKCDPLYVAVVNETEKNLRAWAASEEAENIEKVIHCKDCQYYDHDKLDKIDEGLCSRRIATETMVKETHYCGYAILNKAEHPLPPYDDHEVSGLLDD